MLSSSTAIHECRCLHNYTIVASETPHSVYYQPSLKSHWFDDMEADLFDNSSVSPAIRFCTHTATGYTSEHADTILAKQRRILEGRQGARLELLIQSQTRMQCDTALIVFFCSLLLPPRRSRLASNKLDDCQTPTPNIRFTLLPPSRSLCIAVI